MAVRVHSPRGICARPALQDAPPTLRARSLAVWVAPGTGREIDAEVLIRAALLVLERALEFAPVAEVHWPAAGAATSAAETEDAPTADVPMDEEQGREPDGGSRLPPSVLPPVAGTVHQVSVDLAAGQVRLPAPSTFMSGGCGGSWEMPGTPLPLSGAAATSSFPVPAPPSADPRNTAYDAGVVTRAGSRFT